MRQTRAREKILQLALNRGMETVELAGMIPAYHKPFASSDKAGAILQRKCGCGGTLTVTSLRKSWLPGRIRPGKALN
jgi:hypothetical protein